MYTNIRIRTHDKGFMDVLECGARKTHACARTRFPPQHTYTKREWERMSECVKEREREREREGGRERVTEKERERRYSYLRAYTSTLPLSPSLTHTHTHTYIHTYIHIHLFSRCPTYEHLTVKCGLFGRLNRCCQGR